MGVAESLSRRKPPITRVLWISRYAGEGKEPIRLRPLRVLVPT
jgi:hypothetical protein